MTQQPNVYVEIARAYHKDRLNGASRGRLSQSQPGADDREGRTGPSRLPLALTFSGATLAALIIALVH